MPALSVCTGDKRTSHKPFSIRVILANRLQGKNGKANPKVLPATDETILIFPFLRNAESGNT